MNSLQTAYNFLNTHNSSLLSYIISAKIVQIELLITAKVMPCKTAELEKLLHEVCKLVNFSKYCEIGSVSVVLSTVMETV